MHMVAFPFLSMMASNLGDTSVEGHNHVPSDKHTCLSIALRSDGELQDQLERRMTQRLLLATTAYGYSLQQFMEHPRTWMGNEEGW